MKKKFLIIVSLVLIVALGTIIFAACVPKNAEKAIAKLEDKGYEVDSFTDDGNTMIVAEKGDNDWCNVYYFIDSDTFKKAKEAFEEEREEIAEDIKEMYGDDYVVKYGKNMFFEGTKQAWKDFN